jgi:hypothetical protein
MVTASCRYFTPLKVRSRENPLVFSPICQQVETSVSLNVFLVLVETENISHLPRGTCDRATVVPSGRYMTDQVLRTHPRCEVGFTCTITTAISNSKKRMESWSSCAGSTPNRQRLITSICRTVEHLPRTGSGYNWASSGRLP